MLHNHYDISIPDTIRKEEANHLTSLFQIFSQSH